MAWFYLFIAGLLEVCWAVGLKYTDGFTRVVPSVFVVITLAGSMILLGVAMTRIPLGTAYAVWVGIGALGASILGTVLFHEQLTLARGFFLVLLVVSIVGLKFTASSTS